MQVFFIVCIDLLLSLVIHFSKGEGCNPKNLANATKVEMVVRWIVILAKMWNC